MPHTYTNDIVTFYEDSGEGPLVVLIHGHSLDLRMWQYQVPDLVQAGFRVIRYDVRGHGRTMVPPLGYTWENYAADLRDLLDRLNVERPASEPLAVSAVHLVALSMGGGLALRFTLDYPQRVLSLTLVDSAVPGFDYSEETTGLIKRLREVVLTEGVQPAFERVWLTHALFDGVRRNPETFELVQQMVLGFQAPQYVHGISTPDYVQPEMIGRLREIVAPALVIVGEHDRPDFLHIADILEENLRSARKLVMAGCWHLPPLEKPDAFNRILIDFLHSTSGRG